MANNNSNRDNIPLDEEWMSRLMEGKLSEEEEAALSADMDDSELLADAVEGLEQFSSINQAQKQAHDINQQLLEQLKNKSNKKRHQPLSMSTIIWITLVLVIVLALIGFYLVKEKGL